MRTTRGALSLVCALPLLSLGPSAMAADTAVGDRAAIDQGHAAFVAAMRANDCSALLRLVSDDAVFVPPHAPNASGKEAVRTWCETTFRQAKTSAVTISDRGVTVAGDWAIEHAKFDWSVIPVAGGGPLRDQGSVVAIWHRQSDGPWKLTRDIWNSSQPLPGPK